MKSGSVKSKVGKGALAAVLLAFSVMFLYPMYWMINLSFKDKIQASSDPYGLPTEFHLENYTAAWGKIDIPQVMLNSIIYTAGACILCLALSVMVAYALTRMRMKHSDLLRMYFTIGMIIPIAVLMIPVYRLVVDLGLKNTYWALILPYAAFNMASSILMICAFFRNIPVELEEAAAIDGCGVYRAFVKIMLPLVKPAIVTQMVMVYIFVWNEFSLASVIAMGEQMRTVTIALYAFFSAFDMTHWGVIGAAVTLTTLPIIVIYTLGCRQIEGAMSVSAGLK
ncbi:MAG: carbohydrate ABC transporter permease [Lachnospiraceae bacterium]|nr:carbohydrate ABC transporter permease [Lachnospiraceae bacterium]